MCAAPTTFTSPCLALLRTSLQLMHGKWLHCSHQQPWTDPVLLTPLIPSSRAKPLLHHPPAPCALQHPHRPPKPKSFSPAAQNHPVHPSELLRRNKSSTQQCQILTGTSTHLLFYTYQYPSKSSALDAAILQMP